MIIDFHTHTFPDEVAPGAIAKLAAACHARPFTDGTLDALAASMAAAGVDRSIILPVATSPRQVPHINEAAARLNEARRAQGLFSFGCIHPDCPDWAPLLDEVQALGLRGIKIHPVYQRTDLDDPRYLRILERAGALGLVVVTHTGRDIGFPREEYCLPAKALRALRQVGPVKLVLSHMGGWRTWEDALELLSDTGVYVDTSASTGAIVPLDDGHYAPEELPLLGPEAFLGLVRAFGPHRVLFGTDSPWGGQREDLAWLRALPLRPEELEAILGGNALRLLGPL